MLDDLDAPASKKKKKGKGKVETAGALELGSREAASALAKFQNRSGEMALKEAQRQTKLQEQMVQALNRPARAVCSTISGCASDT